MFRSQALKKGMQSSLHKRFGRLPYRPPFGLIQTITVITIACFLPRFVQHVAN